jgi:hypothetical protein
VMVLGVDPAMRGGEYTAVTLIVDGKVYAVEDFNFSIENSIDLRPLGIDETIVCVPGRYEATFTAKLNSAELLALRRSCRRPFYTGRSRQHWTPRWVRAVDQQIELSICGPGPRVARTYCHIQRGCGPGGHSNSKTSRKLIVALERAYLGKS